MNNRQMGRPLVKAQPLLSLVLACALVASMLLSVVALGPCEKAFGAELAATRTSSLDVEERTQAEIARWAAEHDVFDDVLEYEQKPSLKKPYSPGELTDETQQHAVDMLNFIRFTAGLNDDVTVDSEAAAESQAACLINALNGKQSHYPEQPAGLSDRIFNLGYEGAGDSNLIYSRPPKSIVEMMKSFLEDSTKSNISHLGHRRWILDPSLKESGFGYVTNNANEAYAAQSVIGDSPRKSSPQTVAWPAQQTPLELLNHLDSFAWSLSTGVELDADKVSVTLKNLGNGKTWRFSSDAADGDFYVNNDLYGQVGCVIFRPDGMDDVCEGDVFQVRVALGNGKTVEYTVEFFSLNSASFASFADSDACEACPLKSFTDLNPSKWYHDGIHYCIENGIMMGMSKTTFSPNGKVSRAQVATILYNLAGKPALNEIETFTDVESDSWYYNAVMWARSAGVVSGYDDGSFKPNASVTREQLAVMLCNYARNVSGLDVSADASLLSSYTDEVKVSDWAASSMAWCVDAGVLTGTKSGSKILLNPLGTAVRSEAATMIMGFNSGPSV